MFAALARFSFRHKWLVLITAVVLLPLAGAFGGGAFSALKSGGFEDPGAQSRQAEQSLARDLGGGQGDLVALYRLPTGATAGVDDPTVAASISAALGRASGDPAVVGIASYYSTHAPQFVAKDGRQTFAVLSLRAGDKQKETAVKRLRPALQANGLTVSFGGLAPVNTAVNKTVESDLQRAELIVFPVTTVLLVIIFGSLVSGLVPLVLGAFAILLAFTALRLLTLVTDVSVFAINIVTFMGLGLAIDYSLFLLSRYREELPGRGVEGALIVAVSTTGRAVAFSGITVAASLIGLFVFPQVFLHSMAMGGIAVTLLTVLLSLTVLPALIAVLGPRIDAVRMPWARQVAATAGELGLWHRLAMIVMRRPVVIAATLVVVLLVVASPFLRFRASQPDVRVLSISSEARRVSDSLASDFLPHETTPLEVVLHADSPVLTPATIGDLYDYVQRVAALPGVARVDSMFSLAPNQPKPVYQQLFSLPPAQQEPALAAGLVAYSRGGFTRLAVISRYEVDADAGQAQVAALRDLPPPAGMNRLVGGPAAQLTDLKDVIKARTPYMLLVIGAVMAVVLFLVFGSVTLPLKAMVMNILSLSASYGAMVWIFQDGRLQGLLRYSSLHTVDATQPILMFAIVFGLSMDYEVLLLSRVREEYERTGDNTLAVAHGLEKTGRLITSAAGLLVVVTLGFSTASMVFMKELFIGMALAVAIDATLVRGLLVPAAMRLMGRWNWWAPAPLAALWRRIGLGGLEGKAEAGQAEHPVAHAAGPHPSPTLPSS